MGIYCSNGKKKCKNFNKVLDYAIALYCITLSLKSFHAANRDPLGLRKVRNRHLVTCL